MPYTPKRKEIYRPEEHEWFAPESWYSRRERMRLLLWEWGRLLFDAWVASPGPDAKPGPRPGTWTGATILRPRKGVPEELAVQIREGYRDYRTWTLQIEKEAEQAKWDPQKLVGPYTFGNFVEKLHMRMQEYHYLRSELEPISEKHGRVLKSMPARVMAKVPTKGLSDAVKVAKSQVKEAFKVIIEGAGKAVMPAFEAALPFLLVAGLFWIFLQKPPKPEPEPRTEGQT